MRRLTLVGTSAVALTFSVALATAATASTSSTTKRTTTLKPAAAPTSAAEIVENGSAATDTSGWTAGSEAGPVQVSRITGVQGPFAGTTALEFSRTGGTGGWAEALGALQAPATALVAGSQYTMSMWVRNAGGGSAQVGMLLANGNYNDRPSSDNVYSALADTNWHRITKTFIATSNGSSDTAFYLALPGSGSFQLQVAAASVQPVVAAPVDLVVNSSGISDTSGWSAGSEAGPIAVSRVSGLAGPFAGSTALQFSRSGGSGGWAEALGALHAPSTGLVAGKQYTMQAWVRDVNDSGAEVGILLANGNYNDQPSSANVYLSLPDAGWHQLTKTFTATANGSADTGFYLGLPTSGAFTIQVAGASVRPGAAVATAPTGTTKTTPPTGTGAVTTNPAKTGSVGSEPVTSVSAPASSAASSPASTGQATDPSGQAMPVGNIAGWHQIFTDNFTTPVGLGGFTSSSYAAKWGVYDGFTDTSGNATYSASKVLSVSNGALDMYLHTEGGTAYSGAVAPLINGSWGGQQYGRYSVRFRADSMPGYGAAFLLWSDTNTWTDGEVDFPEGSFDGTINTYNHCVGDPQDNCFAADTGTTWTGWHTATTEWTRSGLTFYLDGKLVGTSTSSPSAKMHMVLQTGSTGSKPAANVSGHVQIDWVSIWTPTS